MSSLMNLGFLAAKPDHVEFPGCEPHACIHAAEYRCVAQTWWTLDGEART